MIMISHVAVHICKSGDIHSDSAYCVPHYQAKHASKSRKQFRTLLTYSYSQPVREEILSTFPLPLPGRRKHRPKVGLQWSVCHSLRFRRRDTVGHQWAGQHRTDIGTCLQYQAIPESISNETSTDPQVFFLKTLDLTCLSSPHGSSLLTKGTSWGPCFPCCLHLQCIDPPVELLSISAKCCLLGAHTTSVTKSLSPVSSLYGLCLSP